MPFLPHKKMLPRMSILSEEILRRVVNSGSGVGVSFKAQPQAGEGAFVQPPTFAEKTDLPYLRYERMVGGKEEDCVCLNTIQAEANCMEAGFLQARRSGALSVPVPEIVLDTGIEGMVPKNTQELGHRTADALLGCSDVDGVRFTESEIGRAILGSSPENLVGIYKHDPISVILGVWDSHDKSTAAKQRAKVKPPLRLQRAVSGEIHGVGVKYRDRGGQFRDVIGMAADFSLKGHGTKMFDHVKPEKNKKGKDKGEAATAGFAQVPHYQKGQGGVSMKYALYEGHISAPCLRTYRFPTEDGTYSKERDEAAREVLFALALLLQTLRFDAQFDLRSQCHLVPEDAPQFVFRGATLKDVWFSGPVSSAQAVAFFEKAHARAAEHGLGWDGSTVTVVPGADLRKVLDAHMAWEGKK